MRVWLLLLLTASPAVQAQTTNDDLDPNENIVNVNDDPSTDDVVTPAPNNTTTANSPTTTPTTGNDAAAIAGAAMGSAVSSAVGATVGTHQLKILTLNTWLLAFMGFHIGKDMRARAAIMGRMISQTGADIVALQESWPNHDKREIAAELATFGYPYSFFKKRGLNLGNGLVIISKYPILNAETSKPYREVTQDTEIFAKKAALYAEIEISPTDHLDFFTTHMGALSYEKNIGTYNVNQKKRQRTQYLQLRSWILKKHKNAHMILAGDFNADYRFLQNGEFQPQFAPDYLSLIQGTCGNADLTNTFLTANHMDATSTAIPTYDYQNNPYAAGGVFAGAPSETEDYIFECGFTPDQISKSEIIFKDPIPADLPELQGYSTTPLRMSDHFSLTTTFTY